MSTPTSNKFVRALLPLSVFAMAFAGHFIWFALWGGTPSGAASGCASCDTACAAPQPIGNQYIGTQSYLLGYSIALPLAFAAFAIRQFFEHRAQAAAKGAAVGGLSLSALLGFAGCWMTGCCGSPMLGVYISLLGAGFLPFAKPLVAGVTTLSIAGSFWWLKRSASKQLCSNTASSASCCEPGTQCGPAASTANEVVEA